MQPYQGSLLLNPWGTLRTTWKVLFWVLGIFGFLWLIWAAFFYGFSTIGHKQLGEGQHFGYVTAVSCDGLLWYTCSAYIKTDAESTQEDHYCVADPTLLEHLRNYGESGHRVKISYTEHLNWSPGCAWTSDHTIRSVVPA